MLNGIYFSDFLTVTTTLPSVTCCRYLGRDLTKLVDDDPLAVMLVLNQKMDLKMMTIILYSE